MAVKTLLVILALACFCSAQTGLRNPAFVSGLAPRAAAGGPIDRSVAHDAGSEFTFTSTSPATATHTPSGTPRGVLVLIGHSSTGTDIITGVTYGGVSMTRVNTASEVAGEIGRSYIYFLGSSIPTGAQTVAVSHTGTAFTKWVTVVTLTGTGDLEVAAQNTLSPDTANPQIALDSGSDTALRYCVIFSGADAVTDLTLLGSHSAIHDIDGGTVIMRSDRQTTRSSGSFTIGYTAASDDVAMCAVAIK